MPKLWLCHHDLGVWLCHQNLGLCVVVGSNLGTVVRSNLCVVVRSNLLLLLLVVRSSFGTVVTIGDWNNLELEGKKARFACIGKL